MVQSKAEQRDSQPRGLAQAQQQGQKDCENLEIPGC